MHLTADQCQVLADLLSAEGINTAQVTQVESYGDIRIKRYHPEWRDDTSYNSRGVEGKAGSKCRLAFRSYSPPFSVSLSVRTMYARRCCT